MSALWAVPVIMVLVGGAAMVALLRGTAESARELAAEVSRFGEVHGSLARLRGELQRAGGQVRDIRGPRHRH